MLKFFRKHNKKLLAVFMALLLIVWLGGSALTALVSPDRTKEVIAHSRYGDIRQADQMIAAASTEFLNWIGINWTMLGQDPRNWPGEPLSVLDWVLLTREARQMGLIPTAQELDGALRAFRIPPEHINRLAVRRDINPKRIRGAFADFVSILQLQKLVLDTAMPSEAEVRVAAYQALEKVRIEAVALRAMTFADPRQTFSDDQIQKQFQEYREAVPVPDTLTFGYYQPPRVKVLYIQLDRRQIEDDLRVGQAELERRAKDYWRENRDAPVFRKPPATQPADETTTQPATQPAPEYYETFTEARQAAFDLVRSNLAAQTAENLANWLSQQLAEPFFEAKTGPDKFKTAPDAVKDAGYLDEVMKRIPPSLAYPNAVRVVSTGWFRRDEAITLPVIGTAFAVLAGGQSVRLGDLAFQVQGLATIPAERGRDDREMFIAQYQFSALTLRDTDGNLYLFRVIDVEPAHSPESVEVVRDQVIEDLRLKSGLAEARSALEELKEKTMQGGDLAAAWEQNEQLKAEADSAEEGYFGPIEFPHRQLGFGGDIQIVPGLRKVDTDFIEACFTLGGESGEGPKLAILELPATARVVLVRWIETIPMTGDRYFAERSQLLGAIALRRQAEFSQDWITPKLIQTRNEFKWPTRKTKKKDKQQDQPEEDEQESSRRGKP